MSRTTWTEHDIATRLQAGHLRVVGTSAPAHELPIGWEVRLTLPYPLTENTLYPTGTDGRRHLSKAGKAYVEAVGREVLAQWPRYALRPLTGPVGLALFVTPPDHRRRDLLNTPKLLCDALTKAGVWEDDSQIALCSIRREPIGEAPAHVKVIVSRLQGID